MHHSEGGHEDYTDGLNDTSKVFLMRFALNSKTAARVNPVVIQEIKTAGEGAEGSKLLFSVFCSTVT